MVAVFVAGSSSRSLIAQPVASEAKPGSEHVLSPASPPLESNSSLPEAIKSAIGRRAGDSKLDSQANVNDDGVVDFPDVARAAMIAVQGWATALGQVITGDLDGNHEVSLSDVAGFVECLSGPDSPAPDPQCVPAMFDGDDDLDLHDVAGFQRRFGFGVGPPRIDRFWPTPGEWIVDDVGLAQVEVGFSEPVIVPREAIVVWLISRGIGQDEVDEFTQSYDADSDVLTITFDPPLKDDRVTVVLDYTIEDLSGRPLDGEIRDPENAKLPSGNGINGGQGVFRISVLQGDANRDAVVDATDSELVKASLGLCDGEAKFDTFVDLNGDGCVTTADVDIVSQVIGHELPATDGQAPTIVGMRADGAFGSFEELWIDFDEIV
jgi:hypothetical protein